MNRRSAAWFAPLLLGPWVALAASPGGLVTHGIGTDRFMAGRELSVRTPVAGDLISAGANLDIDADVGGDALLAGGTVRLNAPVHGNLYMAGAQLALDAMVQRNVRIAGARVELGPRAHIAGNASVAGSDIRVLGTIEGYLKVRGRHVFLDRTPGYTARCGI